MSIRFASADIDFSLDKDILIKEWICKVITLHKKSVGNISYLFCSDEYIYNANVRYLSHNTYTDIITFDSVTGNQISGDILVSIERVEENAKCFSVSFEQELYRVFIHGVLHLLGYKDKTEDDSKVMRRLENESLEILSLMKH